MLLQVIAAVQNGMTFKQASEKYGAPASLIHDKKNMLWIIANQVRINLKKIK